MREPWQTHKDDLSIWRMLAIKLTGSSRPVYISGIVALLATAFSLNWGATAGLHWPYDLDHMRDIGMAVSIANGNYGSDPVYLGERAWYPPLVPSLLAALSLVTGFDVPTVSARAPLYLNLAAPISFSVVVWQLLGPQASLFALVAYLFMLDDPSFYSLSMYSAWGFPITFMQSFFYVGVFLVYRLMQKKHGVVLSGLSGALTGLTFSGHTASALMLFGMCSTAFIYNTYRGIREFRSRVCLIDIVIYLSLMVVFLLPYLANTWLHYMSGVINHYPQNWLHPSTLHLNTSPPFLVFVSISGLVIVWLSTLRRWRLATGIALSWALIALFFFSWTQVNCLSMARVGSTQLPSLVPSVHFMLFLKSACAAFFGLGVAQLLCKLTLRVPLTRDYRCVLAIALAAALSIFSVYCVFPPHLWQWQRHIALKYMDADRQQVYERIVSATSPTDVFSVKAGLAESLISPAGRKLVSTSNPYFSNPFVSWRNRKALNEAIWSGLESGTFNEAFALLKLEKVSFILADRQDGPAPLGLHGEAFTEVFRNDRFTLFRVRLDSR